MWIILVPIGSRHHILQGDFCELMFVGVADYGANTWQGGDFGWGALGVASGDDDFGQRILALDAADGGAGILIGGVCDSAGIQDYEVGFVGCCAGEAAGFELAFEGGAVGLGGAASEILDVVGGHGTIVAQSVRLRLPPEHASGQSSVP
jgi:hypothetical protein